MHKDGPQPSSSSDRSNPAPEKPDPAGEGIKANVHALRRWGLAHPGVAQLMATVPNEDEHDADTNTLAWETQAVPGLSVNGTMRVSLIRVRSHTPEGTELVGQIQAIEPTDHPLGRPRLGWFVHRPKIGGTRPVHDADAWFARVLERHYDRGGEPVQMPETVCPR